LTLLYLVRHGATEWTKEASCQGSTDLGLSAEGHWQATKLADFLSQEGLTALYVSDLKRCLETAAYVEAASGLEAKRDARLREINFGAWEGRLWSEIVAQDPEVITKLWLGKLNPPGGESLASVVERVMAAVGDIERRESGGRVAIVFHGGPIRIALRQLLGLGDDEVRALQVDPASVSLVEVGSPAVAKYINFVTWEINDS